MFIHWARRGNKVTVILLRLCASIQVTHYPVCPLNEGSEAVKHSRALIEVRNLIKFTIQTNGDHGGGRELH